jgi:hypothetical protein
MGARKRKKFPGLLSMFVGRRVAEWGPHFQKVETSQQEGEEEKEEQQRWSQRERGEKP